MKRFFKEKKYLLPFIFLVTLYPLIVQAKEQVYEGDFYKYWTGATSGIDYFIYYKRIALIATAIILIIIVIMKLFTDKDTMERLKKQKVILILAGVYSLLIIASTIFSAHKEIALYGFVQSSQGMFTQLSYIVVFLAAVLLIKDIYDIKVIINSLILGALIISAIGIFQYLGMNFWESEFGHNLMFVFDSDLKELVKIGPTYTVYGTLYHKDYMGSYYAMIVPLTLGLTLLSEKILSKIGYAVVFGISTYTLIICHSRGGLGGAVFGVGIVLIFTLRRVLTSWKKALMIGLSVCVIVVGVNIFLKDKIGEQTKKNLGVITHNIKELFSENKEFDINKGTGLREVINEENRKGFVTENDSIIFSIVDGKLKVEDIDGNKIEYTMKNELQFVFSDKRYNKYNVNFVPKGDNFILVVKKGRIEVMYEVTKYYLTMINNGFVEIENTPIEKWGFNGKERLLSSRGYIWSRSIPLLKNAKLIGYGPDTFVTNFPQHDFIGKLYSYYNMNILVDKPHNMYLQIALDNGLLALGVFLFIILIYVFNNLRCHLFKRGVGDEFVFAASIAAVIGAYLVTGVVNDNRISVSPVFFLLFGTGFALIYSAENIIKEKKYDKIN